MDVNSELRDAQLEIRDSDYAASPNTKGLIWFDRISNKIKMMFNSVVKIIASESWATTEMDTIVGNANSAIENGLVMVNRTSKPSSPSSGKRKIFATADGLHEINSAGVSRPVSPIKSASTLTTFNTNFVFLSITDRTFFTAPVDGFIHVDHAQVTSGSLTGGTIYGNFVWRIDDQVVSVKNKNYNTGDPWVHGANMQYMRAGTTARLQCSAATINVSIRYTWMPLTQAVT